jgi:hypothetical protein
MKRTLRALVGGLIAGVCLAPQSLAAQELTPDQLAAAFTRAGFEVEAPIAWTWMSPPHTTLRVHDRLGGRVLMALVYRDSATAAAERVNARARAALAAAVDDAGPRLVPGYGPSAVHQNVALVQASQVDLERWFAAESLRSLGMPCVCQVGSEPASTAVVAADFMLVLAAAPLADL